MNYLVSRYLEIHSRGVQKFDEDPQPCWWMDGFFRGVQKFWNLDFQVCCTENEGVCEIFGIWIWIFKSAAQKGYAKILAIEYGMYFQVCCTENEGVCGNGIWIFKSAAQKMKGYAKILAIEEMELDFLECAQKICMDNWRNGIGFFGVCAKNMDGWIFWGDVKNLA